MTHTTVLHVDDDPALLEMSAALLESTADFSVVTATSASDGHRVLESEPIDCVISDYNMPGQNGIEFLESVREVWPELPFILFTGQGSEAVASDAIAAGVTDYLQKGAGSSQYTVLANRIENAVVRHRTANDLERRTDQYEAVAQLSRRALESSGVETLLAEAVELVADRLGIEYARIYQYRPEDETLVAVASVGWSESDEPVTESGPSSVAGYAFETGTSVIEDFESEPRFPRPEQLEDHDGRSSIGVAIGARDDPWGVLTTHSTGTRTFSDEDVTFVQSVANVLGAALERQKAERREDESDERFREIAELSPDGIFRTDTSGRFTYVSPASERLLGAPAEDLLGTSFEEFLTPESEMDALEGFASVVGGETVTQLELRLVDSAGDPFDVEVSATPIRHDGETVYVQGFARDVTERKQRERDLQHSQELFHGLVENFPNGGVFLVDEGLRFTMAGGDELELGGLRAETMLGKRPSEVFPPENGTKLDAAYQAALDGEKQSFEDSFQGRHYHDLIIPISDADGEIVAALGVAQNVTQRVQDKQELERQNRRLEEFASAVSHDLRGPLNVAEGRLEFVRQECESDHLDAIANAHARMDDLIDSLLSLARQGRTVGETTVVDVEMVVRECWGTLQTQGCRLTVAGTRCIRADESRLRQLFENLIRNSVEHGSTGSRSGTDDAVEHGRDPQRDTNLTVRVGPLSDGFYIEDDGPGIEGGPDDAIFERAVTTKPQGTGFGLAIVREIVEAHGWEIAVSDAVGGGLRFEVTGVELVD